MAFRTAFLEAVGGFDPRFRTAGDDVDVCWRLQDRGWTLGFHPAAVVWHHRRNSVRTYWRRWCHKIGRAHGLNSSHGYISYAVFCLKKKKNKGPTRLAARYKTTAL